MGKKTNFSFSNCVIRFLKGRCFVTCINFGTAIVCVNREPSSENIDLRTRKGNEEFIKRQVKQFGGFSIFWITENQKRAMAGQRLVDSGSIIRSSDNDQYPWSSYKLAL